MTRGGSMTNSIYCSARMIKQRPHLLYPCGGDRTMNHVSLVETARRRVAMLGNIELAPPNPTIAPQLGAAFPHLGGWPHAGANPAACPEHGVHAGGTQAG
jgi:hypothetical protein